MAATEELKYLDNERAQELIDETKKRIKAVQKQVYKPGGKILFADLPAASEETLGMVYNIMDAFETTNDFVEGEGVKCAAGTDVAIITIPETDPVEYKYNLFGGSGVIQSITQPELEEMWKDPGVLTLADNTVTIATSGGTEDVEVEEATGALSVESSDEDVATASVSGTTITITAVAAGTATITVTSASTANNRKATAEIEVTCTF